MKGKIAVLAAGCVVGMVCHLAAGDGMIVPVRPDLPVRGDWSVKHHHVKITVRDQVASVHIDQAFVNNGRADMEVEYLFPIPPGAAIDSMTMVVDGKELTGKIMEAKEARKIYEDIVRKKKDPALLEYVGYGVYRTRAFPLQKGKPANVVMTYTTVCRKDHDLVEVFYPLNTEKYSAKKIDSVKVSVDIKEKADVTAVYSPSHDLKVERKDARHVVASYDVKDALPDIDFQVYYKAADEKIGATVLSHRADKKADGYFMVLVSPNPKTAVKHVASKDVVIVLDRSGSMSQNGKIDQAKKALHQVVSSLGEEDRFGVITFCGSVDKVFPKLVAATKKKVDEAIEAIDRIDATGGTNIDEAVGEAFGMFDDEDRPSYVLFLTDGIPTVGERNEGVIIKNSAKANKRKVRLFALGVGYDVNVRLVDKLVRANRGTSDYVKPKEPLEAKVSSLYNKIKRPVMIDVAVAFDGVRTSMTYPRELPDLFDGDQIVMVGRYADGGKTTLKVTGKLDGKDQKFEYAGVLAKFSETSQNAFVERLWAVRRVGFLLDEIQLNGESKEVIDELVKLSKQYGIMTPYTSFLADESVALGDRKALREHARRGGRFLAKNITGGSGQAGAMTRQRFNDALRAPAAAKAAVPEGRPGGYDRRGTATLGWKDGKAYEAEKAEVLSSVQNVGNQTLYRRGRTWLVGEAADLDLAKEADKINVVQRFSKEYFELVGQNTIDENRIFASQRASEELVVRLRGKLYQIK